MDLLTPAIVATVFAPFALLWFWGRTLDGGCGPFEFGLMCSGILAAAVAGGAWGFMAVEALA